MSKVFVSHSSDDKLRIEREILPALRGHDIEYWYAPEGIEHYGEWEGQIPDALDVCDRLLVVMSENAEHRRWIEWEVQRWRTIHPADAADTTVAIQLNSGDATKIHPWLDDLQHLDFRVNSPEKQDKLVRALQAAEPAALWNDFRRRYLIDAVSAPVFQRVRGPVRFAPSRIRTIRKRWPLRIRTDAHRNCCRRA